MRHESQLERVLGRGGRWELSGRDWASWNATYGPKGKDGLPVPLWDGKTGRDRQVRGRALEEVRLEAVLEKNWKELGPKLAGGKVNIWVGDADDYFLNVAVRRLKDATDRLQEPEVRRHDPDRGAGRSQLRRLDAQGDARQDGRTRG